MAYSVPMGVGLFLASVSFRGPRPVNVMGSGTAPRSSSAEFEENIRLLSESGLFLDSAISHELPRASGFSHLRGRVRRSKVLTLISLETFAALVVIRIFSPP